MKARQTGYRHIELGIDGQPVVETAGLRVAQIVVDFTRGFRPDEIADEYSVPLSAVHSALAYYYDHPDVIATAIADRERLAERLQASIEPHIADLAAHLGAAKKRS